MYYKGRVLSYFRIGHDCFLLQPSQIPFRSRRSTFVTKSLSKLSYKQTALWKGSHSLKAFTVLYTGMCFKPKIGV